MADVRDDQGRTDPSLIKWEPSEKTPGTTFGRVGEILFFRVNRKVYGSKWDLHTRTAGSITSDDAHLDKWTRAGFFESDEAAIEAAEKLWPRYLHRLRLAAQADFIDYIGEGAQAAIIEAITSAAQNAAADTGAEMERELGQYGGTIDDLRTTDYDGWAAEAIKTAIATLRQKGILPPETEE